MEAINNVNGLIVVMLDHKENILKLDKEKRYEFARMLLTLADTLSLIRINLGSSEDNILKYVILMREHTPMIEKCLSFFMKKSAAVQYANVFNVNTNVDDFISELKTEDEKTKEFSKSCIDAALNFRKIAEACIL
jgi:hypothetical protein